MNFLALCQRTCVECGVASGQAILSALPTVVGATGSLGRVVNWVGDAWNDIQCLHDDWDWMRSSNLLGAGASFPTVAGQASYPIGVGAGTVGVEWATFGKWDRETFRSFPTSVGIQGEQFLDEIPYDAWRDAYMFGAQRAVQMRPVAIAVGPNQSLNLGPPSNGLYTITGDYFAAPTAMVADTDTPMWLPARFELLIVYYAMKKYGQYEAASEVIQRGNSEGARVYAQLQAVRAPRITFGGALA
jgi:hypothetical protein